MRKQTNCLQPGITMPTPPGTGSRRTLTLATWHAAIILGLCAAGAIPQPVFAQVGASCQSLSSACLASGTQCSDGVCKCKPGFVACGTACVDINSDELHCGSCSNQCGSPFACQMGQCKLITIPPQPVPPHPVVSTPMTVGPGSCSQWESHPQRSINDGMIYQTDNAGPSEWSWMKVPPVLWSNTQVPPVLNPALNVVQGDEWTASSGYSGLEYMALRTTTAPSLPYGSAPGIAAATPANLRNSSFDFPDKWAIHESEAGDGVSIATDEGGPSLWLAATNGSKILDHNGSLLYDPSTGFSSLDSPPPVAARPYLYLFPNCRKGHPGDEACPRASFPIPASYGPDSNLPAGTRVDFVDLMADMGGNQQSHDTVVVNPCTHHALVSFIRDNGDVVVRAVDLQGKVTRTWVLDNVGTIKGNTSCPLSTWFSPAACTGNTMRCPGADDQDNPWVCRRYVPRVQLATKATRINGLDSCRLYAGWDEEFTAQQIQSASGVTAPGRRFRAAMAVVDITDESATKPKVVKLNPGNNGNQMWNSTPVASRFSDSFGWFYFRDSPDNSHVTLEALVGTSLDLTNLTMVHVSPNMPNHETGDNLSQMLGGLPGRELLGTWPEVTGGSCQQIRGATIIP